MQETTSPLPMRVHAGGAIESAVRLIDEAARPRPLAEVLAALCAEVSEIMRCEVVSVYVREQDRESDALRMVANIGFPAGATMNVRLRVGEGIVGHVAQSLRPVSLELAKADHRFKEVPGLDEERFPNFLAVPLLMGHRAEAVLVVQRAVGLFTDDEILLAVALATSFAYALERARARRTDGEPAKESSRAVLHGIALCKGLELGRVETLPTFEGLAALWAARYATPPLNENQRTLPVADALASVVRALAKARKRVLPQLTESVQDALQAVALMETDARLHEAICGDGTPANLPLALRKVARDYAQVPYRQSGAAQAWAVERSAELEDFCLLVAARASGATFPMAASALLLPERLTAVLTLAAVAHKVSVVAVGASVPQECLAAAIVRAASIPTVTDVGGLFAWAREGDTVLVDGDEQRVLVNPSAAQIAMFREHKRDAL